jgi:hypothetical protein
LGLDSAHRTRGAAIITIEGRSTIDDVIFADAYAAEFAKAYIEDGASRGPLAANTQHWSGTMSEDMKAELERLRQENAALKKGASKGISMKVSEKGTVDQAAGAFRRDQPVPQGSRQRAQNEVILRNKLALASSGVGQ